MCEDFTMYNEMRREECLNCRYYIHYNGSTEGLCLLKHEEMNFDDGCDDYNEDRVVEMPKEDLEQILEIEASVKKEVHSIGD